MKDVIYLDLFLIRTPLQLINAIAARKFFNIKPDCAVLIISYNNNQYTRKQIDYINQTQNMKWAKTIKLEQKNSLFHLIELRRSVNNSINKEADNKLFIGYYKNSINRDIANNELFSEVILLDDGTSTFSIYKLMLDRDQKYLDENKSILNKTVRKIIGLKTDLLEKCTFFTIYENLQSTKNIKVIHHNYDYFKLNHEETKVHNYAIVLGSPYVELKMMDKYDYLELLSLILKKVNKDIVYIPHRNETNENLKDIDNLGFVIKRLNTSIEYEIINNTINIPKKILSFGTSASINLKYILNEKEVKIISVKPSFSKFKGKRVVEDIKDIYEYNKKFIIVWDEEFLNKSN